MRLRGKTDGNHAAIVRALRQAGASVVSLADIGNGCPDLLVGFRGTNLLLEVKDGSLPPSRQKLTADEYRFHQEWSGAVVLVRSIEEALRELQQTDW